MEMINNEEMRRTRHLAVLGYHSISDPSNAAQFRNEIYKHLSVPRAMFEKQMEYLRERGYEFFRFSDLLEVRKNKRPLPHRAALIYFDDGYKDNYHNAYPILKRLNIPATVFVVTDCIDQKQILWDADVDPATAHIFLTWNDLKAMGDVFDVGSHTVTHRKLTSLAKDEVREEFEQSRKRIYEMTGKKTIALSYPKSRWNNEIRCMAEDVGFDFILAHGRGFRHSDDFRHLEKIPVGPEDSMSHFKMKLGMYYPFMRMLFPWRSRS